MVSISDDKTKVLVVEDDIFLKDLLAQRLTGDDFVVLHASEGKTALEMAAQEKPSIILLDIILPEMNGFEIIQQLKANPELKDIPVVFLSNLGQEDDIIRGKELGAVDFLVKANHSLDAIVARVKEIIAQSGN